MMFNVKLLQSRTMKKLRNAGRIAFGAAALSLIAFVSEAQVGIGTTLPQAKLHVHDGSVLADTPELPADSDPFWDPDFPFPMKYALKWFHDKSAFRAIGERVGTASLEPQNIGPYSFASGYENFATGTGSAALGLRSSATGSGTFVTGHQVWGSGVYSFACGEYATASGARSVAMGESVSTDGKSNSFAFGSGVVNDVNNQMKMGFSGGYKLYTNTALTLGVSLASGSNSWSVISDVNKKENFAPVNGEDFLQKINKMNLTSWNYKGQDPKQLRHYGPMAQDFYAAFGKDEYGTIGTDTTINQADFDGVNLIAIQALIRKMDQINSDLREEIASLKAQIAIRERPSKGRRVLVSKR